MFDSRTSFMLSGRCSSMNIFDTPTEFIFTMFNCTGRTKQRWTVKEGISFCFSKCSLYQWRRKLLNFGGALSESSAWLYTCIIYACVLAKKSWGGHVSPVPPWFLRLCLFILPHSIYTLYNSYPPTGNNRLLYYFSVTL